MTVSDYNSAVNTYSDRLFRFVLKSMRDFHRAEDVLQDCYEKLWKNHANVDSEKVKSYLYTTAYHQIIDIFRKDKKIIATEEYEDRSLVSHDNYTDIGEILQKAVERLPEVQKMVLLLRDYEGYSYREIGEVTNLSEPQVKVYIYRARVFLKEYIGKMEVVI